MIGVAVTMPEPLTAPRVHFRAATWDDLEELNALTNRVAVADDTDELVELEDHAEEWRRADFDPERDVVLAVAEEGSIVGWAEAGVSSSPRDGAIRAYAGGGVAPERRAEGIGTALLAWVSERAAAKAAALHPGVSVVVFGWGREESSDSAQLLRSAGFAPARYFSDMRVEFAGWAGAEAVEPLGEPGSVLIRQPGVEDEEAVRLAHNEAFEDHWGSSHQTAQRWGEMWRKRVFRPELSRIAVDAATGEVLAYVLSEVWVEGEQYVSLVGTRRAARGRRLASVLLGGVLEAGRAAGLSKAELGVDAASPTGANGVYERAGFKLVRTGVTMDLPAR